jgi:hypothetical protein
LSFQSLSREIATRHSSHGGEFGERILLIPCCSPFATDLSSGAPIKPSSQFIAASKSPFVASAFILVARSQTGITHDRQNRAWSGLSAAPKRREAEPLQVRSPPIRAALPLIDRARQNAETATNALKIKTAGPERDTSISGHMLAGELRNLLASKNGKQRLDMIAKSLAEGDDSLAGAALSALL